MPCRWGRRSRPRLAARRPSSASRMSAERGLPELLPLDPALEALAGQEFLFLALEGGLLGLEREELGDGEVDLALGQLAGQRCLLERGGRGVPVGPKGGDVVLRVVELLGDAACGFGDGKVGDPEAFGVVPLFVPPLGQLHPSVRVREEVEKFGLTDGVGRVEFVLEVLDKRASVHVHEGVE